MSRVNRLILWDEEVRSQKTCLEKAKVQVQEDRVQGVGDKECGKIIDVRCETGPEPERQLSMSAGVGVDGSGY